MKEESDSKKDEEKNGDAKDDGLGKANKCVKDDPIVVNHLKILEFFAKEELLGDSKQRLSEFRSMVDGADDLIFRFRS